jgi:flavin reductase (DIM6/NTAB) family NADH-FMN oxidoreductase RutF
MRIDFARLAARERYRWMIATILPRPIAFVSTVSAAGQPNLAPFSFFSGVTSEPPIVTVAIASRRGGVTKDTLRNIEETGELVINLVSEPMAEAMVLCSGDWPPEQNEFELSGFTELPSERVRPPRVAESPVSMECRLVQTVRVGEPEAAIVLAEILLLHADDDVLSDGLPDPRRMRLLARLGGDTYTTLGELLTIPRPRVPRS